jgi:lipopolysaccharide heptosyltransferase I
MKELEETPNRILVIRLGSIGDVVHALPALAEVKQAFPQAEVDWLVESRCRSILLGNPWLHELIEVDTHRWRRAWSPATVREIATLVSRLRARRYDWAFDFQGLWKSAAFGYAAGARHLIGFDKSHLKEPGCRVLYDVRVAPPPQARHVIDLYQQLLTGVGIQASSRRFSLQTSRDDERYVEQQLASRGIVEFVAINPGGGWDTKNWAPANYALLHDRLCAATGLPAVLTWGPGEEPLIDKVLQCCAGTRPVTFPTSLPQLVVLLRRARLFVGGDTGPLHLAAACGTPVVGIFGPTSPVRNGPFSKDDAVVFHTVPCGPCYKRTCKVYQNECLKRVQVDEVLEAALRRLKTAALAASSAT